MPDLDHDLRQALVHYADTLPERPLRPFPEVERGHHRRRSAAVAGSAVATAAVTAVTAIAVLATGGDHAVRQEIDRPPLPGRTIAFQGITFTIPVGWRTSEQACSYPDRTVVLEDRPYLYRCKYPGPAQPGSIVELSPLYRPGVSLGWEGRPIDWQGQPAWLNHQRSRDGQTWTLTVPLLNATVLAQAPTSTAARALLNQVTIRVQDPTEVPITASRILVTSFAGQFAGQTKTIRNPQAVAQLLSALHDRRPASFPAETCGPARITKAMATITIDAGDGGSHTLLARFGSCQEVLSGDGRATAVSPGLRGLIRTLVPKSGL